MKTLLGTKEAAKYLNEKGCPVKPGTLEVWRCKHRGPAYRRIARWIFYHVDDLEKFSEGKRIKTKDSIRGEGENEN